MNQSSRNIASGEAVIRRSQFARDCLLAFGLLAGLLIAYWPALNGQPVWDDNHHLTAPALQSWAGLGRIWWDLKATQQYYPLTHSVFWIEHRVWGDWYAGYHLANICLHTLSALLLVRIFRALEFPGAWLAAALWAAHPVQVESLVWMSELKNCLSGVFYFAATLVYLRYNRERTAKLWLAAFGFFVLGLLSKSVIATLPGALLLIVWWRRGRISWKQDVLPLIPFFAAGAGYGVLTSWVERTYIGAQGSDFHLSLVDRCLVAGHAFWFYLGKLAWPADLIFIYPHWSISAAAPTQYIWPAAALALAAMLIVMRKQWGRGPLVAMFYFAGTLFPALGFVDVFPFRYSYVADHFQYLASIGPLALAAAGLWRWYSTANGRMLAPILYAGVLAEFGLLIWQQSGNYRDKERLWQATLAANPDCWLANNNIGYLLTQRGDNDAAMAHYEAALRSNPDAYETLNNYANLLEDEGKLEPAIEAYQKALQLSPNYADARMNLANAFLKEGNADAGIREFQTVVQMNPDNAELHSVLGDAYQRIGRRDDAVQEFETAIKMDPKTENARYLLGCIYQREGNTVRARELFEQVLQTDPNYIRARQALEQLTPGLWNQKKDALA